GCRPRSLARREPADLSGDGQDDGEVRRRGPAAARRRRRVSDAGWVRVDQRGGAGADRKSTRLNSSHLGISYAVFCLKKKTNNAASPPWPLPIVASSFPQRSRAVLRGRKFADRSTWFMPLLPLILLFPCDTRRSSSRG